MNGKIAVGSIIITALIAGGAMWYLQLYAFYDDVNINPEKDILMTTLSGQEEILIVDDASAIDATSSPIRFRACFKVQRPLEELAMTYAPYNGADPLVAPGWFDCFDAVEIGETLKKAQAQAFLSQANIAKDVDRVIAVFSDGRAFAWHQLNPDAKE